MSTNSSKQLAPFNALEHINHKILVLSGKGGVGKSTVAASLAVSLAKQGKKTGLLDVDLHGPSITQMFGLYGWPVETDEKGVPMPIEVMPKLQIVSIGMMLNNVNDAVIWRGPMKYNVIKQFLQEIEWGALDYLVIDSPPGTGDEPLAVAQLAGRNTAAIIVTTPQKVALSDVRRSIHFCKKLELPTIGIVENMSGFACPHCGGQVDLFNSGGGKKLAEETGVPFLGGIPFDPEIVNCGDQGGFSGDFNHNAFVAITDKVISYVDPNNPETKNHEAEKMKIAIPTAEQKLCMHFGHCEKFALVEVNQSNKQIIKTEYMTPPVHEPGVLPKWLHEQGVNVIIAGGMGQHAQELFKQNEINVVVGAAGGSPEDLTNAYINQTLETGTNVCDH
jgi:Mrp family chromosome partitioning ATPase/predicted Fe-Mo cluster-binding NifX family protein